MTLRDDIATIFHQRDHHYGDTSDEEMLRVETVWVVG